MPDGAPESAQGAGEQQAPPVPAVSQPSGGQQASVDATALEEKLVSRLTPIIERAVQSTKDRRFSKLEELITVAEKLKGVGVENFQAARAVMDEPPVEADRGRSDDSAKVRMQAESEILLKDAGVPFDDAEYKQLVDKYAGKIQKPEDWSSVLRTFTEARKRRAAPPNEAQIVSETRPVSPAGSNEEAEGIIQQLAKMPDPRTRADLEARKKLKDRLNALTGGTKDVGIVEAPRWIS